MKYERIIKITPQSKPILFAYFSQNFSQIDTRIRIYDTYKLSILLTNELALVVGENIYNTFRGDVLFLRPQEIHFGRILRSGVHRYIDFLIPKEYFDPQFPGNNEYLMEPFYEDDSNKCNIIIPEIVDRKNILTIAERLSNIAEKLNADSSSEPAADLVIFSSLVSLLYVCRPIYYTQKKRPVSMYIPLTVRKTMRYINDNFSDSIQLNTLAESSKCSVTYLMRVFKQYTGKTIHQYIIDRRLSEAKKLLKEGNQVTQAAYLSGFVDSSSFIKCFKQHVGITPKEYIKKEMNSI